MKKWLLTCSKDGTEIDYDRVIESETEPDFWTCYNLAAEHGCEIFTIDELEEVA